MRYVSSGHSHGEQITIILEGIPANLELDLDMINSELKRRQCGYGRGKRMELECDEVQIISGVLFKKTTGAPICMVVKNRDYRESLNPHCAAPSHYEPVHIPRPGHADLVGGFSDYF